MESIEEFFVDEKKMQGELMDIITEAFNYYDTSKQEIPRTADEVLMRMDFAKRYFEDPVFAAHVNRLNTRICVLLQPFMNELYHRIKGCPRP